MYTDNKLIIELYTITERIRILQFYRKNNYKLQIQLVKHNSYFHNKIEGREKERRISDNYI